MYCFDTNIVIDIFHGDLILKEKISQAINFGKEIFITPITLCELYKGVYLFKNPEKELADLEDFISNFEILEFDKNACVMFGKEYARLSKTGKMTQESDLMIASIARTNNLKVITRNKRHFENIDVEIEVW